MPHLKPNPNEPRYVAPIPGVPDAQAQALDRRRRLDRQHQGFRSLERVHGEKITPPLTEPAGQGPA